MFPDSLTFSVDAAYASQAFCGVPSILDECYNRTIFCWLFHFTLNLPWQQANSPKQKSMIFTLKGDPVPSWSIGQKIRLHFIHTPQLWNCSVPSGEAGEKQTKWQERKCECVCVKYTFADAVGSRLKSLSLPFTYTLAHPIPPHLSLPPLLLLSLSFLHSMTLLRFPVKCNPEKWICYNRWSGKWICIPKTQKPPNC